ncbi:hypothetical protein [Microbacterium sp. MM2322]|uniref:hypothetical protein n=1 Tax=Microbacterium sp. MM2322 TaxID=3157631 RepID=UPI0032D572A0
MESLHRFTAGEPLWRVHEAVFGVLALESDPIDPRARYHPARRRPDAICGHSGAEVAHRVGSMLTGAMRHPITLRESRHHPFLPTAPTS